ncbi:hypothetical protein [Mucilaginibacter polytrichastri]|uniref:Peptidase S74 domain-containing protein n=1 Tax=Mucilaginibacter polytrichastri TaxID=1302689 RepID=A0A1Q5ZT06_9SPHI|nr:hypothetical protein [Mucilaginibacter polytrichastri]OKS84905.1 hypothetical protein RG47T_0343 [Mucilaginibacter polytrichastri]SFS47887.1 hypothetical protein SAMN04487890_101732 [Mucilaginibacter polytrichastri]
MKKLLLAILSLIAVSYSYAQTTLSVDANGVLNVPKIITSTSLGQSFFTGHQMGTTYGYGGAIFSAITDNPNGVQNYYYHGITNSVLNFSVRADGQGYFAGNVGIGTSSPTAALQIVRGGTNATYDYPALNITTNGTGNIYGPILYLNGLSGNSGRMWGLVSSGALDAPGTGVAGNFAIYDTQGGSRFVINSSGNVGIGTTSPQTRFHISDTGTSSNSNSEYSGNLIIQANTGGRSFTTGSSLEFVIPANTDGSNPWGQGRIITVAGNSSTFDATGKMIMGTRRMFDKGTGNGVTWNYGDDLVIDGTGNIGIGTTNPNGYKLAVKGTLHSQAVQVDMNGWSDYVFDKDYDLASLKDIKTYIDKNHHLPEIPSADRVAKDGINLGEMNAKLLKKIEELTLYLIEKDNQLKEEQSINRKQQEQLDVITRKLNIK